MLTFIIITLVSLMILTFLLLGRRGMTMFNLLKKLYKELTSSNHHHNHGHKKMPEVLSGELIVTGQGEIHIELPKRPKEILAAFGRYCDITPCNPRHFDELKCYMCHFHKKFCLVIKWDVSNSRKIVWQTRF